MSASLGAIRVATYNVHGCVGVDRKRDADRVASVICGLGATVVGLQEVDTRARGGRIDEDQLERLADRTEMVAVPGYTIHHAGRAYGNALLTRHPVIDVEHRDISVPRREPRGVLVVTLDAQGTPLVVAVTHFGLRGRERVKQVRTLLDLLHDRIGSPIVLLGDFNEWWPRAVTLAELHGVFGYAPPVRSFPSRAPILALDRIWAHPREALSDVTAVKTPLARRASDHLPVTARVAIP